MIAAIRYCTQTLNILILVTFLRSKYLCLFLWLFLVFPCNTNSLAYVNQSFQDNGPTYFAPRLKSTMGGQYGAMSEGKQNQKDRFEYDLGRKMTADHCPQSAAFPTNITGMASFVQSEDAQNHRYFVWKQYQIRHTLLMVNERQMCTLLLPLNLHAVLDSTRVPPFLKEQKRRVLADRVDLAIRAHVQDIFNHKGCRYDEATSKDGTQGPELLNQAIEDMLRCHVTLGTISTRNHKVLKDSLKCR